MIPRSSARLLGFCLIASTTTCVGASLDDYPEMAYPYLEDSFSRESSYRATVRSLGRWTVLQRDQDGRPVVAREDWIPPAAPNTVSTSETYEFSWGLPVELPLGSDHLGLLVDAKGCTSWPSHVRTTETRGDSTVSVVDFEVSWNDATRSLTTLRTQQGSAAVGAAPCPWRDSIAFDGSDRPTVQVTCMEDSRTLAGAAQRWTRIRHYDSPSDSRPRWTSEHSTDTARSVDSVAYFGPVETPTHKITVARKSGAPGTILSSRTDSLFWNSRGQVVSRIYHVGVDSARAGYRYRWDEGRLLQVATGGFDLDSMVSVGDVDAFTYGTAGSAIRSRSDRAVGLRRTSQGLVVIPRIGTVPARVEWTSLEGRRQPLRIAATSGSSLTVAVPPGPGFLRVTQDDLVRTYGVSGF